jgi:hypothetical protein
MAIPNYLSYVEQARQRWPQDWKDAHTGNANTEGFIKKLASWLHYEVDPLVGLNGKRGDPNDLSDDALNHQEPGMSLDVRTGLRCSVIDCIGSAGASNAHPTWGEVWDPAKIPTHATWVKPARVHDGTGPSLPPQPPTQACPDPARHAKPDCPEPAAHRRPGYPGDHVGNEVGRALFADYAAAGQPPDDGMSIWMFRTAWDASNGLTMAESLNKHRQEWRKVLGL